MSVQPHTPENDATSDPFANDLLWACCIPSQTARGHADDCKNRVIPPDKG